MHPMKSDGRAKNFLGECSSSSATEDARSRRILRHATIAFLTHGYAGTSVETIAIDASVSKLTIYRLFDDKLGLATAVLENLADSLGSACRSVIDMDAPIEECLQNFGVAYLRWMTKVIGRTHHYAITRLLIELSSSHPESVKYWINSTKTRVAKPLAEYLMTRMERGELFDDEDPIFIAGQFQSGLIQTSALLVANSFVISAGDDADVEDMVRRKVRLFLRGCARRIG
jgi:TetR/AcrR family transcriptional repressor of mexJK operon